jgi:tetratricopeptide (TPR) repeat protein
MMKLTLSPHKFCSLVTGVFLIPTSLLVNFDRLNGGRDIANAAPKNQRPNSNMVYPKGLSYSQSGSNIEKAKSAMFRDGNYLAAKQYLEAARKTEPNDPLVYAMSTLYPYSAGDMETVKIYGDRTVQSAKKLMGSNPLRGNLYQAVGLGIGAAYEFKKNGGLAALSKLQQVFKYMDAAKKIDPNDPELNLIKGYMDLLLAVNLPFSDAEKAIDQLKKAEPKYLAYRGIYIGYRDLQKYDNAIAAINNALQFAPNNPELKYYQAQIYAVKGKQTKNRSDIEKGIKIFETAYEKRSQLLISTVAQILSERCQAVAVLNNTNNDSCWGFEEQLKRDNLNVVVGPKKAPKIN